MAVADEAFRKKCVSKIITDTISNSRTLLFVSHDIRNIAETCNKIICLNEGKLVYYGEAIEGIKFSCNSLVTAIFITVGNVSLED